MWKNAGKFLNSEATPQQERYNAENRTTKLSRNVVSSRQRKSRRLTSSSGVQCVAMITSCAGKMMSGAQARWHHVRPGQKILDGYVLDGYVLTVSSSSLGREVVARFRSWALQETVLLCVPRVLYLQARLVSVPYSH